jgi:RNA polymerase primary sigma factor
MSMLSEMGINVIEEEEAEESEGGAVVEASTSREVPSRPPRNRNAGPHR